MNLASADPTLPDNTYSEFIGVAIFQNKTSAEIIIIKILPFEYIKTG